MFVRMTSHVADTLRDWLHLLHGSSDWPRPYWCTPILDAQARPGAGLAVVLRQPIRMSTRLDLLLVVQGDRETALSSWTEGQHSSDTFQLPRGFCLRNGTTRGNHKTILAKNKNPVFERFYLDLGRDLFI